MGQYYYIVNINKNQYLNPHRFGNGLKLLEFGCDGTGITTGLVVLLASGNGRGGGDLHSEDEIIGSWAGDRIVVAGDYADEGEFLTKRKIERWRRKVNVEDYGEGFDPTTREPNLQEYACTCMEDISGKVMLAMCADEWVRQDILKGLMDGFANSSEENKALVKEIAERYDCQEQVDQIKAEIAEYWRKQREKWDKERNNG